MEAHLNKNIRDNYRVGERKMKGEGKGDKERMKKKNK